MKSGKQNVASFLNWAFGQLATRSFVKAKCNEQKILAARVLKIAIEKGSNGQKAKAIGYAIRFRCYQALARQAYRSDLKLSQSQLSQLSGQVRNSSLSTLSVEEIGELISLAKRVKAPKLGAVLAEVAIARGESQSIPALAKHIPEIVTRQLMTRIVKEMRSRTDTLHYNHPCLDFLRSHEHLLPEPMRHQCVAFLCSRGFRFGKSSEETVLEYQFNYFLQFDPWKMLEVAAPKNRALLQKGLDEAVIRFGMIDQVKNFAKDRRLRPSPKAIKKAVAKHAKEVRFENERHRALLKLRSLLAMSPIDQKPACMALYKEKQWAVLGELLQDRQDIDGEVRLETAKALCGEHEYSLAAKVMAVDRSSIRRRQFVASITTLPALCAADKCGLPVTREKIKALFSKGELRFVAKEKEVWKAERLWVDSVAWAAIRLGSSAEHRRGLSALKPLLSKNFWARLWSLHLASQLKLQGTTGKLLALITSLEQDPDDDLSQKILEVLGPAPYGLKVIGA